MKPFSFSGPFTSIMAGAVSSTVLSALLAHLGRSKGTLVMSSFLPCLDIQSEDGGLTAWWEIGNDDSTIVTVGFSFRSPRDVATLRGMEIARRVCFEPEFKPWARVVVSVPEIDGSTVEADCLRCVRTAFETLLRDVRTAEKAARRQRRERFEAAWAAQQVLHEEAAARRAARGLTTELQKSPKKPTLKLAKPKGMALHVPWWTPRFQKMVFDTLQYALVKQMRPETATEPAAMEPAGASEAVTSRQELCGGQKTSEGA